MILCLLYKSRNSSFPTHIIAVSMTAKTFLIALICISAAMASGPVFILDSDVYDSGIEFNIETMKFIIMIGIKQET